MAFAEPAGLESDPRFPSGPWTGFFLDRRLPGKHRMELRLTFQSGGLAGDGRDIVGAFRVKGQYDLATGKCRFHKRYVGKHDVFYDGFNEGKGIWGVWELTDLGITARGGFHIWPEGMPDPTGQHLSEEADVPAEAQELVEVGAASLMTPER
jgi:hypothetical protein